MWKASHTDGLFGPVYSLVMEERLRLGFIQSFYDTDDIFRREIDGLREKMAKKKIKIKEVEKKINEFLKEGEYRRYMETFENMKLNYESRKNEMAKIDEALH